jgi:hypothetical protein
VGARWWRRLQEVRCSSARATALLVMHSGEDAGGTGDGGHDQACGQESVLRQGRTQARGFASPL